MSADEHASHHPGAAAGSTAGSAAPGDGMAMDGSPAGTGSPMAGMMDEMMGNGERRGPRPNQIFARLAALPPLDAATRHQLDDEADSRIHQALTLVDQASAAAERAASPDEMQQASQRLREGLDLYQSGVATRTVALGQANGQSVALDWFRDQLNLPASAHDGDGGPFYGLSPAHLFLMTLLIVVSAGLLALQLLRLRRVRELVGAGVGRPAFTASPIASGPALARTATMPTSGGVAPLAAGAPEPSVTVAPAVNLAPSALSPTGGAALRRPKSWTGTLRVAQIVRETPTIKTFRFVEPSADRLPFDFLPGQFLQVEVEPQFAKPVRRSYTISSSPTQRAYVELTIKREEQGVVSRYLHDQVKVGDFIKITGPFGAFTFTGSDAESIVLIAGGVGITPMMSVLRYLTDTAWPGEIFFVYGARSTDEFVFRAELEQLERRHEKLHVFAAMHRSPGTVWLGPEGNISREMLQGAVPDIVSRRVHLCGPPPMMTAMKRLLIELGVPEAQIHTEAFGPASLPADDAPEAVTSDDAAPAAPPPAAAAASEVAPTTVTFSVSGVSAALPKDQTVLEAAEGAGVEIPYSCRIGECGVCVTRLLQGQVTMAVESGLDPTDKAQGYILACQAKSTGVPLVVEA